jgi:PAS domain S-box-containing protein
MLAGILGAALEQRQTEASLRQTTSTLQALVASSQTGILFENVERQAVFVNPAFCRLFGFASPEVLLGRDCRLAAQEAKAAFLNPERFVEDIEQTIAAGESHLGVELHRADGRVFERDYAPVSVGGAPGGHLWHYREITERKHAEALIVAERNFTESLLNSLPGVFYLFDAQGRFLRWNKNLEMVSSYSNEEVSRLSPLDFIAEADRGLVAHRIQQVFSAGQAEAEANLLTKDGRQIPYYFTGLLIRQQNQPCLLGMGLDISGRKKMEEVLRRSERNLERAQAVGHIGSWIASAYDQGSLVWSKETFRIFGLAEGQFDGRVETFLTYVHPDDRAALLAAAQAAWAGERPYELEHRIVRPDGAVRWVHEQAEVERDATGNPTRMVGVVQDITERRILEEQLRQSQKMEAVGQLAGGVAHDFNNILTATLMLLGMLEGNPSLDAEAREFLKELGKGARRAADLTRQLLLFSRRSPMQVRELDLNDLLTDLQKMLRRLLGEDIIFEVGGETGLPLIQADKGMIEQMVVNLCVNARDAMPEGGRLSLRTAAIDLDAELAKGHPDRRPGRFIGLSISDTGCGMDEPTLKRIFEPFFTTKEVGKGTGLGLATVHGIVKQHKGWIEVESLVGQGTTFRVILPAIAAKGQGGASAADSAPIQGGHETILLVEDEPAVRTTIGLLLKRWGYQVLEAGDGLEAGDLWRQHRDTIDLLYTDMVLPGGVSGLELAERFRAERPRLRVLLSSGYSADLVKPGRLSAMDVTYVPKPCAPAALAEAVRKCLAGQTP